MERASGILLPLSALPSPHGIGTMGQSAYDFIDFLSASGQSYWQLLPLGPTSCGNSPYSSYSTFAGNPYYIDPDFLVRDGFITKADIPDGAADMNIERVDYDALSESRELILRKAFKNSYTELRDKVAQFCCDNAWVGGYALYLALKQYFNMQSWTDWRDEDIRLRKPAAVKKYEALLADEIAYHSFVQYLFFSQWNELRSYGREKGISFIGDIPIYAALDSADVWSEPQFFLLDEKNLPIAVAGCPPDDFCEDGQLWGNPLFDWETMKADGYGWWIRRVEGARRLYDMVRIDHFRGLESYWAVDAGEATAINGHWCKGPGLPFVKMLGEWFYDMRFIAEDLGMLTQEVHQLVDNSGFPGMKVLEFAFDSASESLYLPHNCTENSVCYLGTHDNNTVLGWVEELNEDDRRFAEEYMHITKDEGWCRGMIRTGMATASKLFIMQMQDILELGADCRTNIPGIALGNWEWRMKPDALTNELSARLLETTRLYRRCPLKPRTQARSEQ